MRLPRLIKGWLGACFFISSIALIALGIQVYFLLNTPMLSKSTTLTLVELNKNTSAADFVHILKAKKLIYSSRLLLWFIRFQGVAAQLKAGVYQIKPGETAPQLLKKVVAGEVLMLPFTIIEGSTVEQVTSNLKKAAFLNQDSHDWQIVSSHKSLEGQLLADTYYYGAGSQAKTLLQLANQHLEEYLEQSWQQRDLKLPYKSSYELLIAASIIEKEAFLPAEKTIISSVIVNRLKKNMPLQMDPTVIYALGANYHGKLSHEDLAVDSLFNTYRYKGLPPTPIAMVGKTAIAAAAHPEASTYLYFVATGDGSHYFSTNYDEQRKAIDRYQHLSK